MVSIEDLNRQIDVVDIAIKELNLIQGALEELRDIKIDTEENRRK